MHVKAHSLSHALLVTVLCLVGQQDPHEAAVAAAAASKQYLQLPLLLLTQLLQMLCAQ